MIMADLLKIVFIIAGVFGSVISVWLLAEALYPSMVDRVSRIYSQRSLGALVLGSLTAGPFAVVFFGLMTQSRGLPQFLAGALFFTTVFTGIVGAAGLARRVGIGLASPRDDAQPWRRVLRGGIVLCIAFLLPFAGWFAILPATLLSGFGAVVLSIRLKRAVVETEHTDSPVESAST